MAWETEELRLSETTVGKGVAELLRSPDKGFYVVAESADGTTIGQLMVTSEWSDWNNGALRGRAFEEQIDRTRATARPAPPHARGGVTDDVATTVLRSLLVDPERLRAASPPAAKGPALGAGA